MRFWGLTAIMTIALLGIVVIQVYWLRDAYEKAEVQFDRHVLEAMNSAVDRAREEAARQMWKNMFGAELPLDSLNSAAQRTLNRFMERALQGFAGGMIWSDFSTDAFRQLLESEMEQLGISGGFEFAIVDQGFWTSVRSNQFDEQAEDLYRIQLVSSDFLNRPSVLFVHFPKRRRFVWSELWPVVFTLFLLISTVIYAYARTLSLGLRQKRISDIKSDFLNNMTHEFKTPISTIGLALDAMNNPVIQQDEQKRTHYQQIIREENKRMLRQVEHILTISQLEKDRVELKKREIPLSEIVEKAQKHLQLRMMEAGIEYSFTNECEDDFVLVDEVHFTNAVINVLDNAIKYRSDQPTIRVRIYCDRQWKVIEIADNGLGMDAKSLKHIFDKFYRVETGDIHNVKGHGLGLSYVDRILQMHGGEVAVESELHSGSVFKLKLTCDERIKRQNFNGGR